MGKSQPLFLSLDIQLRGVTTRQEIQQHLTALADVYSTHWTHHPSHSGAEFVKILTRAPTLHQFDIDDRAGDGDLLGPLTDEHAGGWVAALSAGYDDPDPAGGVAGGNPDDPMHPSGFTARIMETLLWRGREEGDPRTIWECAYPMAQVPIPARDPRMRAGMGRLGGEFGGRRMVLSYERGFRSAPVRVTAEMTARLRMAGHEVPPPQVQVQARERGDQARGAARRAGPVEAGGEMQEGVAHEPPAEPPGAGA